MEYLSHCYVEEKARDGVWKEKEKQLKAVASVLFTSANQSQLTLNVRPPIGGRSNT